MEQNKEVEANKYDEPTPPEVVERPSSKESTLFDSIKKLAEAFTTIAESAKSMTWKGASILVFLVTFLAIGTALGYAYWENRDTLVKSLMVGQRFSSSPYNINIPDITKESLIGLVNRNINIAAVEVIQTNFNMNTRRGVYFYSADRDVSTAYDKYQETKVADSPLFIIGDGVANDRIIRIIRQEVVCLAPPEEVIRRIPVLSSYKMLCSMSIPHHQDVMVGYINFWLREPIPSHLEPEYGRVIQDISTEIWNSSNIYGK